MNGEDYRPINWPIKHPYWCTGYERDYAIIVAYADDVDAIQKKWPEATDIDWEENEIYYFSDRFPKPDWFNEKNNEVGMSSSGYAINNADLKILNNILRYLKMSQMDLVVDYLEGIFTDIVENPNRKLNFDYDEVEESFYFGRAVQINYSAEIKLLWNLKIIFDGFTIYTAR